MADILSTDAPLTADERAVLAALLDTLVPAGADGRMPSAAAVDFDGYLRTQASDFVGELKSMLKRFEPPFADLAIGARGDRVAEFSAHEPDAFRNLLTRVYDCYYQDDRVRLEIGVATGAPFPQGNEVTAGDLSLLDPVIANSTRHRYRKP